MSVPSSEIFYKVNTTSIYYLLYTRLLHLLAHLTNPVKFGKLSVLLMRKLTQNKRFFHLKWLESGEGQSILYIQLCVSSQMLVVVDRRKCGLRQTFIALMILSQFRLLALPLLSSISCSSHQPLMPVPSLLFTCTLTYRPFIFLKIFC